MVEKIDIERVNTLYKQYLSYQEILAVLEHNARIVSFTVAGGDPGPASPETGASTTVTIDAEGIQTPPQMMTAIKSQVEERIKTINNELNELGVTS